jgi:hypothetical protein
MRHGNPPIEAFDVTENLAAALTGAVRKHRSENHAGAHLQSGA